MSKLLHHLGPGWQPGQRGPVGASTELGGRGKEQRGRVNAVAALKADRAVPGVMRVPFLDRPRTQTYAHWQHDAGLRAPPINHAPIIPG